LANFIEVERVSFDCFRNQSIKNLNRVMSKKLDEANLQHGKTIEEALKFQEEQNE